ncbi:MAG: hypothetical protein LBU16_05260 [Treponema sp.]|jgi:hypothetical protein|nr:hypothetical protein [Treponema sp.]
MPDEGQGGEVIGAYAAQFLVYRKGKDIGSGGKETPGGKKEDPIENEGFNKRCYGYPPFDTYARLPV